MEIFVKALPVEDILKNLGEYWQTEVKNDAGEITIELPKEIGEGYIRGTSFDCGIGVIEYNVTFFKNTELHFTLNETHPLKFVFCAEGRVNHAFEENEDLHTIDSYQNIIVSSSGHNGHVLHFKENECVHVVSLEVIRSQFKHRNNYKFKDLDPLLKELFKDEKAKKLFFYQGNYSIQAADIVEAITHKEHTGFLRSVFLQGKVFEMLAKQIAQYHDDLQDGDNSVILRRSDVEKVKRTVDLIHQDMSKNYSVDYLAKEVGTNVNKLQEGFKYMFNLTVNKYVQQIKLQTARDLLSNSDHNISQIVNQIGLNNRSYFSKIFKEKYGVSPKYFLNPKTSNLDEFEDEHLEND